VARSVLLVSIYNRNRNTVQILFVFLKTLFDSKILDKELSIYYKFLNMMRIIIGTVMALALITIGDARSRKQDVDSRGRHCVQIANTACLNVLNANHHREVSAYNCMEACREDVACTGGFHFHTSFDPARITDTCHMFGVKGAIDKKCIGRTIWLESTGFICN